MTTVVYDKKGRQHVVTETSSKGGEGRIFTVNHDHSVVAKIFNPEKRTLGRYAKVQAWETLQEERLVPKAFLDQVIAPGTTLYARNPTAERNPKKLFIGYEMKKLENFQTLKKIYLDDQLSFLEKAWVARNLAVLTNTVHNFKPGDVDSPLIIGDFNADNIAVLPQDGCICKLIDVDSCQMTLNFNQRLILCPTTVCQPEILAPEIARRLREEKANLETVAQGPESPVFSRESDRFALACHIFALLMNGFSPFSAVPNMKEIARHPSITISHIDVNQNHAADNGEFVFAKKTIFKKPPDLAPKYAILTRRLQKLFERAFIEGSKDPNARPSAGEFFDALDAYINELEQRKKCGHWMPAHYKRSCEWCRLSSSKK